MMIYLREAKTGVRKNESGCCHLAAIGQQEIILRAARNDTFEKSRFMMEIVSPTVDLPSAVEFGIR